MGGSVGGGRGVPGESWFKNWFKSWPRVSACCPHRIVGTTYAQDALSMQGWGRGQGQNLSGPYGHESGLSRPSDSGCLLHRTRSSPRSSSPCS